MNDQSQQGWLGLVNGCRVIVNHWLTLSEPSRVPTFHVSAHIHTHSALYPVTQTKNQTPAQLLPASCMFTTPCTATTNFTITSEIQISLQNQPISCIVTIFQAHFTNQESDPKITPTFKIASPLPESWKLMTDLTIHYKIEISITKHYILVILY
jgi:hypothetical protein